MRARLTWELITLQLRNPFRISHGTSETRSAHWLRLAGDEGWGEGTIPPYYGVTTEAMAAVWGAAARRTDAFPDDPAAIAAWMAADPAIAAGPAPARAALDLALHDRIGRGQRLPLYRLLDLPAPPPLRTSFTLAIDTPEALARQAAELTAYPVLKLKLGGPDDVASVAAVRAARPDATLYIDANAAWTPPGAIDHLERMSDYDVAVVEQPVARDNILGMGYVQRHISIPVVADESLQTAGDLEKLAEAGVRGVNLKLMKLGGLGPAMAVARRARELGMGLMLGCMIETSIGATAMAHLAGLADWLDLDAPLLVANDPFDGLRFGPDGALLLPDRPGIGAIRRA
jgi:L-alanine-DL-glutamate epimerase-like enolase superfamily enzyme